MDRIPLSGGRFQVSNIVHKYAAVLALNGVSLEIASGSFTAVLGPNGAGKSTLAQILCGVIRPSLGEVEINGLVQSKPSNRGFVDHGIVLVPEGRRLFGQMTVRENLLLGAYGARCDKVQAQQRLEEIFELMPQSVRDGHARAAATLSGGEQQMLALGRAMMAAPSAIVMDEPSLGLAPILIEKVYGVLGQLNQLGVTVVVIEQVAAHAMRYARSMAVLDRGTISYCGSVTDEAATQALQAGYLGNGKGSVPH